MGWSIVKIGDICRVDWGNTSLTKKSYTENGDYLGVSAAGCDGRMTFFEHEAGTPVLSAIGANCGRMFLPKERFTAIKNTITLTPNDSKIKGRFLYYLLKNADLPKRGAGQPFISKGDINAFEVTLPPIPEQQRIVAILDQAFADIEKARANAERNLKNARELFDSYLNQVFSQRGEGWIENKLDDVCDLQNGYAFKSGDYVESSNTLNIRMSNIRPNGLFDANHNIRYLPDSYAQKYSSFLLKEGDLIIAMTDMAGDPKILGLPTLVHNSSGCEMLMNQRVGKLCDFSSEVYVPYLCHYLSSPIMKEFYKSKGAGGLQLNISKKDILSASIPLPPIPEQQRIVESLDKLSEKVQQLEKGYQEKLTSLEELKKSLLQKAFSGELTKTEGHAA